MKFYLILLPFLILLPVAGCDITNPAETGIYKYTAFDEAGNLRISGTLGLRYEDTADARYPIKIEGVWVFKQKKETEHIRQWVGQGSLRGSIDVNQKIYINLTGVTDQGTYLVGRFENERFGDISGDWVYTIFGGRVSEGRFEAKQM